ncbi:response regulator transcription factor [bacterium]|nr:response regulator transcription factor [bacterium]
MINVCIIDDHEIVRQGVKKILGATNEMRIVQEASSPTRILNQSVPEDIHIIILDLSFDQGYCDLSSIELIKGKFPSIPILIFSMMDEAIFGLEALKYKVSGFVSKQRSSTILIQAIQTAHKGNTYISSELSQILASQYTQPDINAIETLTNREKEVLMLLGAGLNPTKISKHLFLSIKTISTYKRRILDKLQLENSTELIKFCLQNKLINL